MQGKQFRVQLQETGTLELYYQENTSLHVEDSLANFHTVEWDRYREKRKSKTVRTREMTCQTIPSYTMDKTTQKSATPTKNNSCMATQWSMYDEYRTLRKSGKTLTALSNVVMKRVISSRLAGMRQTVSPTKAKSQRVAEERTAPQTEAQPSKGIVEYYVGNGNFPSQEKESTSEQPEAGKWAEPSQEKPRGIPLKSLLRGLGWMERLLSTTENIHLLQMYSQDLDAPSKAKDSKVLSQQVKQNSENTAHKADGSSRWQAKEPEGQLEALWQFSTQTMADQRINQVAFTNSSKWLLMAAYGSPSFEEVEAGALCGWSAKRMGQPEVRIPLPRPATVVSSCPWAPHLCCVAMMDGSIHVYQLDTAIPQLVMDTSSSIHKHYGPVWAVEWRESYFAMHSSNANGNSQQQKEDCDSPRTDEVAQALVSVSEDGTVKDWIFFKKQIIRCTTLMKVSVPPWVSLDTAGGLEEVLRPGPEHAADAKESSAPGASERQRRRGGLVLPVAVPATAVTFRPNDATTYLLGTVAGDLLMCRTFERQGCIAVFRGHSALVTRVAWRPVPKGETATVFLSAALDETVRVWHADRKAAQSVLRNPQASAGPGGYVDACWCPWYTNVLAAVHGGGLHLWDVSLSTHTPLLTHDIVQASCVAFSSHTRNLAVGARNGAVSVLHLDGMETASSTGFYKVSVAVSKISMLGKDMDEQEDE